MKKQLIAMSIFLGIILAGCGVTEDANTAAKAETSSEKVKGTVEKEDFDKMYTNPADYKGYEVEFTGKVFVYPEKDNDGIYLQVWADPENSEKNMVVGYPDPQLDVKSGDYIAVKGIVMKAFKGENAFGAMLTMPQIQASNVEVVDYITAVAPAIKTVELNEEIDQHGYIMQLQKIEFAETQTRVYLKVINNMNGKLSFYTHSTKLIVGSKQFEEEYIYDAGLPELHSDLISGTETEGVIIYPAIDPGTSNLKFYAEGYSDDWEVTIDPFVFEIDLAS